MLLRVHRGRLSREMQAFKAWLRLPIGMHLGMILLLAQLPGKNCRLYTLKYSRAKNRKPIFWGLVTFAITLLALGSSVCKCPRHADTTGHTLPHRDRCEASQLP